MTIPFALPSVDFLVQLTGDRFNPTGIVTPLTDLAFELIHETGFEFVAYGITDSNGFKVARRELDDFVEFAEQSASIALYDPEQGIAFLEPAV